MLQFEGTGDVFFFFLEMRSGAEDLHFRSCVRIVIKPYVVPVPLLCKFAVGRSKAKQSLREDGCMSGKVAI